MKTIISLIFVLAVLLGGVYWFVSELGRPGGVGWNWEAKDAQKLPVEQKP